MTQGASGHSPSSGKTDQGEQDLKRQILRHHNLPTGGSFPFIPPKNWRPHQPLRKNSRGQFIDIKGRLWQKGPTRTEGEEWEWDVQLPNEDHLNIDWSGNITHPRPKAQSPKRPGHRGLGGKGKKRRRDQKH